MRQQLITHCRFSRADGKMLPRASFTSELARSAFEAVSLRDGYMPTRSPKRRCRSCGSSADASATTHPESGQARVPSGSAARFADASPLPVTPAWLQSPGHLRRPGDFRSYCHAPARLWPPEPSTDSLEPTPHWPARGARLPDRRPAPALLRESGHGRQPPNPPLQSLAVLRSRFRVCQPCWFIPSQPPQGGAMNARAALVLRRSVGAGNPHHNITHHCITPRINGGAPKERLQVGKGISRSKALPAAGYTTRRYVKLLRQSFVAPFSVCPARA